MVLTYRFKKEKLENGRYVSRPKILVTLGGKNTSLLVSALIDSGSDITVIPQGMAQVLGLKMGSKKEKLCAYRESHDVVESSMNITFMGKQTRQAITLNRIPVLVVLSDKGKKEEEDITLGVSGIFDEFDIAFKKSQNRITLQIGCANGCAMLKLTKLSLC